MESINKILVLVNPAASDFNGRRVWDELQTRFVQLFAGYQYEVFETKSKEQNAALAAATDADLIIAVSGDGTVHDIAQGLMRRPRAERPALTVLPIGSGNDFARTLGIPLDPKKALEAISLGRRAVVDVGRCNQKYFLETLSFGIDAAIAINTYEKRKTTKRRGFLLYAGVAVPAIIKDLHSHRFRFSADDMPPLEDDFVIFAVQNGPTYGGGFQIAPCALVNDGLLNICVAKKCSKPYALYALTLIARGKHEKLSVIRTLTVKRIVIDVEKEIPAQTDGEVLLGTHFEIEVCPKALDVLVAPSAALGHVF